MRPATVWLTGLPASGKTSLATALAAALRAQGHAAVLFDGDEVRRTLSIDLGFSPGARDENVRRCAAAAALVTKSGVFALVALVSPSRAARDAARVAHEAQRLPFVEVHLAAPVAICELRDPKGLYARARAGALEGFTGIGAPYEPPLTPELVVLPDEPPSLACERVLARLGG